MGETWFAIFARTGLGQIEIIVQFLQFLASLLRLIPRSAGYSRAPFLSLRD